MLAGRFFFVAVFMEGERCQILHSMKEVQNVLGGKSSRVKEVLICMSG